MRAPRDRRSFAVDDESQIEDLKAEVADLKGRLMRVTEESEVKIESLNRQILTLKHGSLTDSCEREVGLTDKIIELKQVHAEECAKLTTDAQLEVSDLRFTIAELKNGIASREAENARLTLENIDLQKRTRALSEALETKGNIVSDCRRVFERSASALIQAHLGSHTRLVSTVDRLARDFGRVSGSMALLQSRIEELQKQRDRLHNLTLRNDRAVDYLARSLSLVAELPQISPPPAQVLVESNDALIAFVNAAENAARCDRMETNRQLTDASKAVRLSMVREHKPPVSQPVVRVLTDLGAVMMEVNEQMNEEHRRTMRLLESAETSADLQWMDSPIKLI